MIMLKTVLDVEKCNLEQMLKSLKHPISDKLHMFLCLQLENCLMAVCCTYK